MPLLVIGGALLGLGAFWLGQRALGRMRAERRQREAQRHATLYQLPGRRSEDRPSAGWAELLRRASELGLLVEQDHLTGHLRGVRVRACGPHGAVGATLVLDGLAPTLRLSSAGAHAQDRTGDHQFDIKYSMIESFSTSAGALNEAGRGALVALLAHASQVSVEGGRLTVQLERWALDRTAAAIDPVETMGGALELALSAAQALRPDEDPRWLHALAESDPNPGVRLRALQAVAATRPSGEAAALARRALAREQDEPLRGELALIAGEPDALRGLSRGALHHLYERHPDGLVELLKRAGDAETLTRLLNVEMARAGLPLVRALGQIGGEAALATLREIAAHGHVHPNLRAEASRALTEILGREAAPTGALSLAWEEAGGELALTPHAGDVALVPEAGRVSAPRRAPEEG